MALAKLLLLLPLALDRLDMVGLLGVLEDKLARPLELLTGLAGEAGGRVGQSEQPESVSQFSSGQIIPAGYNLPRHHTDILHSILADTLHNLQQALSVQNTKLL